MADGRDDNIFVYLGGEQEVPRNVTHVIIDRSVKIIPEWAFYLRQLLVSVETHDGIEKIGGNAFDGCRCLRGIKLPGVKIIEVEAFMDCTALTDVAFGDELETIGQSAFLGCPIGNIIKIPTVRTIQNKAFSYCKQLMGVELSDVESIGHYALANCPSLQRIAIPLKDNIFPLHPHHQRCTQFHCCENLTAVDLVGVERISKTNSSLLLKSWRNEMNQEIDRINQVLPDTPPLEKADAIQEWIRSVINRIKRYKAEHNRLLKEAMTQLELAVWKAKLDEVMAHSLEAQPAKKAKIDTESVRIERRITSGAKIIIKNVLPFLQLLE
jgi:hypothetical protein